MSKKREFTRIWRIELHGEPPRPEFSQEQNQGRPAAKLLRCDLCEYDPNFPKRDVDAREVLKAFKAGKKLVLAASVSGTRMDKLWLCRECIRKEGLRW